MERYRRGRTARAVGRGDDMAGLTEILIATEQMAYPINSEYYPLIRVFEAPYTVGDCPVDEVVVSGIELEGGEDIWLVRDGDSDRRACITNTYVQIVADSENDYTEGDSYEIRIYASDELVPQVAEQ